ncbi:proline-specific peptidase [Exophiala viscosa]|uniref:proline-specific peptidase n=1 Tax=Exophiala viscosa TaxID=2486360 RepID=UPI00219007E5|nr:proline-specific peptidase [Exophiala viscosa]
MVTVKITENTVPFKHPSLPYPCETYYKIYGDITSGVRPLVTLHGGPGMSHNYLLSISRLASTHSIPVIFYDQIGTGRSTHLRSKRLDTKFWTTELFIAELDNLLSSLNIADSFDLLGQSWGGMLGAMFAVRGHQGLAKLIISNSPASMPLWLESCNYWRTQLPSEIEHALQKHEKNGTFDDPEYKAAVEYFYKLHLCRTFPFPKDLQDSIDWVERDDTVYMTMNGPSEFTVIGSLKDWSIVDDIHKISAPTLVLNGEFDEARDSCVYPFFEQIPKVKWYTFSGASHCSNVEVPERYCAVVGEFLNSSV